MQQQSAQPELGADISPLQLTVVNVDSATLRVKIGAPGRWEVPRSLLRDTVNRVALHTIALTGPCPTHAPACMHVSGDHDILKHTMPRVIAETLTLLGSVCPER